MRKSKISVLLATNLTKPMTIIRQSLLSISDQARGDFDLELLLCVDGYSCSEKVCQLNSQLNGIAIESKLFFTEGQWGLPKCLNKLIRHSDTEIFVRHDDDDIMLADRILNTSKIFRNSVGPILFGTNYYAFTILQASDTKLKQHKINLVKSPTQEKLRELFTVSPPFAHPTIAFSAANKDGTVSLYDEKYTYAQDFKFYLDHLNLFDFTSAPFESIIYRTPEVDPTKRRLQLDFHDLALFEFFSKHFETTLEHARAFRCVYISSEFCEDKISTYQFADQFAKSVIKANIKYSRTL